MTDHKRAPHVNDGPKAVAPVQALAVKAYWVRRPVDRKKAAA